MPSDRRLLILSEEPCPPHLAGQLLQLGWEIVHAAQIGFAERAMAANPFPVCVVFFRDPSPESCAALQSLVRSRPESEWLAVLPRSLILRPHVQSVVAEYFVDYHTEPLDAAFLCRTLGHAYGRAVLRRHVLPALTPGVRVSPEAGLTPREKQIVAALLADPNAPLKVIATGLRISENTLRNHLTTIYSKVKVTSRGGLYAREVQRVPRTPVTSDAAPRDQP
ncbi:MAG: sigma-54-dependent Fis family transcriptional regulator [Ramlibacter sp.]|jgi:DNA-binding CsgD family transcriptional regulator|nr:sigma-54-dependent Fis family transcriptional regulator [Ramlibacter sp.]